MTRGIAHHIGIAALIATVVLCALLSLVCGGEKGVIAAAKRGDYVARAIVLQLRLPRMLLALIAGAMLGGGGAVSQLYFRNPIAEPGILGLSGGATLGAVIATHMCTSALSDNASICNGGAMNIGAFIGALVAGGVLSALVNKRSASRAVSLLLTGTALGTLFAATTQVILLMREDKLHAMYVWTLGSFSGRGWQEVRLGAITAILAIVTQFRLNTALDTMAGGEIVAASLGVEVRRLRLWVLLSLSLSVSAASVAGGTIGFVGLVAPHIARRLFSPLASRLVPTASLCGAALLMASDAVCRVVMPPMELPVGVITSMLGAPFFVYLIAQSERAP